MPSRPAVSSLSSRLGRRTIALAAIVDPSGSILVHVGLAGDLTPGMSLFSEANTRQGCLVLVCVTGRNPIVAVVVVGQADWGAAMIVVVIEAFLCRPLRAGDLFAFCDIVSGRAN